MFRLTIVRCTGQRQFFRADIGTAFDQGQRLQRLDRRTRIYRALDIAEARNNGSGGIGHTDRPAMTAFDHFAARHFDEHRIFTQIIHNPK